MSYVKKLLYSDVKINLTEVVSQNKDVIASKLKLEVNNLDLAANQIADRLKQLDTINDETLQKYLVEYCAEKGDTKLFIASLNGTAFLADGLAVDISGRSYFRLASQGRQNISEQIISRTSGNDIFVISVPLLVDGKIAATIQRFYSPQEIYDLCSISLFSSQGYMNIINSQGYIMISSESEIQGSNNYFRAIYAQGNQDASKRLEKDIQNGRSGFLETENNGNKVFSAYTPIEDIHDWYLISSVATDAVSPNANTVITMFYVILCVVVLVFAGSLLYFFHYKNKQQATIERIAFVDTVTQGNTFNKFIFDLIGILRDRPETAYGLLSFDIDNFKYVNNFYGFDLGDRLLKHIYEDVELQLLPGELIARISGDHFVLLLTDFSEDRLKSLLNLSMEAEGITVYLSAGLYVISDPHESANLMVDKSSTAAQRAKGQLNKKVVVYSEQFDRTIMQNEQLKRQMEHALANREIFPFYQPKVDINTGALVGAEALARWRTADGEMISPGEFIPLCEQTGQVTALDMSIFEQVLEFLERNLKAGISCVPISVNFSRLHLISEGFIHSIVERIDAHHVPPYLVEIELTESVIFENHEIIIDFANHLHEHGMRISMDDFGSGYSSLNLLKDIPIDVLKIDKGFLDATENSDRQRIILSTIAQMAKLLQTSVVVEGVETAENVAMMKEFGCSIAQGFYFSRPIDPERFEQIFQGGSI